MINIQMEYCDLNVKVELDTGDEEYTVNTMGFLRGLEDLLKSVSLYQKVNIQITDKSSNQSPPTGSLKINKSGTLSIHIEEDENA